MSSIETVPLSGDDNEKTIIISSDDDSDDDGAALTLRSKRHCRPLKSKGAYKRVKTFGYNYLDSTLIHPESYDLAER